MKKERKKKVNFIAFRKKWEKESVLFRWALFLQWCNTSKRCVKAIHIDERSMSSWLWEKGESIGKENGFPPTSGRERGIWKTVKALSFEEEWQDSSSLFLPCALHSVGIVFLVSLSVKGRTKKRSEWMVTAFKMLLSNVSRARGIRRLSWFSVELAAGSGR